MFLEWLIEIIADVFGRAAGEFVRRISCSTAIIIFLLVFLGIVLVAKHMRAEEVEAKAREETLRLERRQMNR